MEEKTIISGKSDKKTIFIISLIPLLLGVISLFLVLSASSITMENVYLTMGIVLIILAIIIFVLLSGCKITVTDKRVFGKASFGKKVELPLDSISAVAVSPFKGIAVATSSGTIRFKEISNNEEIQKEISKLLIERQNKEKPLTTTTVKQEIPQSNADELQKYKNLLDSGAITQEEFDAKKKQLLGL